MFLEGFVLSVLENTLGQYIGDYLTERRTAKSRAEVVDLIRLQIARSDGTEEKLAALTLAVQELDYLVREDNSLQWKNDQLIVSAPSRPFRRSEPIDAQAAIQELNATVDRRRKELVAVRNAQEAGGDAGTVHAVKASGDQDESPKIEGPTGPSAWAERVGSLTRRVQDQRRDASKGSDEE